MLALSLASCSALALVRCYLHPSPSIITTDLTTASVGLPPCLQVQPLEGFDLFGVQDPQSLLLAFLIIQRTSASFWRTYTKPLRTANPVDRLASILQPLVVSCDHSNSSYAETSSNCCNYPLGQGRDHVLKSSTGSAVFRVTDSEVKPLRDGARAGPGDAPAPACPDQSPSYSSACELLRFSFLCSSAAAGAGVSSGLISEPGSGSRGREGDFASGAGALAPEGSCMVFP